MSLRNWCFTVYDFLHEDGTGFQLPDKHPDFKYAVFQLEECPTTGTHHWQGYIEFKKTYRMAGVKKLCNDPTMHLEPRRGTQQQAIDYCKKVDSSVGDFMEYGTLATEQGKRSDLESLVAMTRAGATHVEMLEAYPGTYARYHKAVTHIRHIGSMDKPDRNTVGELEVTLFFGGPGKGKSRRAQEWATENNFAFWCLPLQNSGTLWFDGYNGEPVAILEDFSGKLHLDQTLRLLDRYPVQIPVKGGFVWWCPRHIIITSNVHPADWYDYTKRQDSWAAIKRRIHQVINFNLTPPESVDIENLYHF